MLYKWNVTKTTGGELEDAANTTHQHLDLAMEIVAGLVGGPVPAEHPLVGPTLIALATNHQSVILERTLGKPSQSTKASA